MNVKIDTKEKFTVLTPNESSITANMTDELAGKLLECKEKIVPHIILNLCEVTELDISTGERIAEIQQEFYDNNISFVICCLQSGPEKMLDENDILETLNVTPTESEAWDILQMEEIERELLGDDNESN